MDTKNKVLFISHASEDKVNFVKPFVEELRLKGLTVWYDEYEIITGMSIRESIDNGLIRCDIGVVVFSKNYFNKSWTKIELNALVHKMIQKDSLLIPIWYEVDYNAILNFSPSLVDIKAIATNSATTAANEIYKLLYPQGSTLEKAKNILLSYGFNPPEFYSDWWLKAIGFTYKGNNNYHTFPINGENLDSFEKMLAFSGLRLEWTDIISHANLNQFSEPEFVVEILNSCKGLQSIILDNLDCLATYFPQLLLSKNTYSDMLLKKDKEYSDIISRSEYTRKTNCTTTTLKPKCNIIYSFLHEDYGEFTPRYILKHFVEGEFCGIKPSYLNYWCVLIKLLDSSAEKIYPKKIVEILLEGFRNSHTIKELKKYIIADIDFNLICQDIDLLSSIVQEVAEDYSLNLLDSEEIIAQKIKNFNLNNYYSSNDYERLTIPKEDINAHFRGVVLLK